MQFICTLKFSDGFWWEVYVRDHHIIQQTNIKVPSVSVIYKQVKTFFMEQKKYFQVDLQMLKYICHFQCSAYQKYGKNNKANLRDLIVATGLVILLKLDSNCQLFSTCDHEIWWVTLKNNRAPLLYYVKLWASFQIHRWILTGVTVRICSIRVKIGDFLSRVILKLVDDIEKQ